MFISLLIVGLLFVQSSVVSAAAKKLSLPTSTAQYIKSKNVVRAFFGNLKGVKSVSYTLYYQGNGIGQGVDGSFKPGSKTSWSKDLFLGTCSSGVCIRHKNIKNVNLEVRTKYTNGKSVTNVLKVKI